MKTTDKTGNLVTMKRVTDEEDVMIITAKGIIIRQKVENISVIGRNTQGFRLVRIDDGDSIAAVANVLQNGDDEDEEGTEDIGTNGTPQG